MFFFFFRISRFFLKLIIFYRKARFSARKTYICIHECRRILIPFVDFCSKSTKNTAIFRSSKILEMIFIRAGAGWRFRQNFSGLPAERRSETNISWLRRPNPDPTPISESSRFSKFPNPPIFRKFPVFRIPRPADFSGTPDFPEFSDFQYFRNYKFGYRDGYP